MNSDQYRVNKTITLDKDNFLLPFKSSGSNVYDSGGISVAECRSEELAKQLAKILNRYSQNEV